MDTKALRQKILDLAIRGKLVPQDPNDEPASVLLERIREQKQQMVKEGKLKKKDIKNDSVIFVGEDSLHYEKFTDGSVKCIEDEIPFELPEGWEWERLGNVSTIARGGSPRPIENYLTDDADGINWIKIGDTEKSGKYIWRTKEKIKPAGISKTRYVHSGDFLLTNSMSFGRPYILKTDGCIHDGWLVIGNINTVFNQDYLYYALSSNFMYTTLSLLAAGSTVKNLKSDTVRSVLFPIPPFNEQERISLHLEQLITLVDKINDDKSNLIDIINQTKSKILDLAIHGQLVAQNPDDEPASVLLERIHAEKEELIKQGKIKRNKKESIIFKGEDNSYYETIDDKTKYIDDEIPFDLPDGWTWCRLKSLAAPHENSFVDGPFGSNLKTDHYTENREVRIIQLNNIGEFVWKNNGIKYTTFKHAESLERCKSYSGDIVIAKMMPAGRAIIIPDIEDVYIISSDCVRLQLPEYINKEYIMYMINSPTINEYILKEVQGIGRTRTSLGKLKELLVPLPPYNQQLCISKIIKKVFRNFDTI